MSTDRITVHGKQLKLDGHHLADCVDGEAAAVIAHCLNKASWARDGEYCARVADFFA